MTFKILSQLVNLQCLAFAAVAESLLVVKVFPEHTPLSWVLIRTLALNVALYCVFWGLINPYLFSPIRHFPQPENLWDRLIYSKSIAEKVRGQHFLEWSEATPNDGLILLRSPFHRSRLLATKPKALSDLLVTQAYDFVKPKSIRDFLRRILGDGLVVVEGDMHRFQRKHVMPAFNFRHIKDLYPVMFKKAIAMTEAVAADLARPPQGRETAVTRTIEINSWASKATLDIIGIAGLGKELNVLKYSDDPMVHDYGKLLEPTVEMRLFFVLTAFFSARLVKLLPWKLNRVFERLTTNLATTCAELVREKRQAIRTECDDHFDILSLLIKSNDFSDHQLVDQLLTFLAAGHETTSSTLTWICYLLAMHPAVQIRLREEVRLALPSSEPSVDIATVLEKLPLLNGVCNETLRLYPTIPVTMRIAIKDTTLLGQPVPKGTEVILSPWAVNRSCELWGNNAREFVPERWINNDKANNDGGAGSNYSLLTFLHGPRSCIGQGFAKAELRCLVVAFICAFEWSLDTKEDIIPAGMVTIKPSKGLHLRLRYIGK